MDPPPEWFKVFVALLVCVVFHHWCNIYERIFIDRWPILPITWAVIVMTLFNTLGAFASVITIIYLQEPQ